MTAPWALTRTRARRGGVSVTTVKCVGAQCELPGHEPSEHERGHDAALRAAQIDVDHVHAALSSTKGPTP